MAYFYHGHPGLADERLESLLAELTQCDNAHYRQLAGQLRLAREDDNYINTASLQAEHHNTYQTIWVELDPKHDPDIRYKILRQRYEHQQMTNKSVYQRALQRLLKAPHMTDTLRSKIYYQLIRVNIELAQEQGQSRYLATAQAWANRLMTDPDLMRLKKADLARSIVQGITASYTGSQELTFLTLRTRWLHSRMMENFGQGAGVILGNVIDILLLPVSVVKLYWAVRASDAGVFFLDHGFAFYLGKAGKWLGKVSAPLIATVMSVVGYPVMKAYETIALRKTIKSNVQKRATELLGLEREDQEDASSVFTRQLPVRPIHKDDMLCGPRRVSILYPRQLKQSYATLFSAGANVLKEVQEVEKAGVEWQATQASP